jgi:hypothetical protein
MDFAAVLVLVLKETERHHAEPTHGWIESVAGARQQHQPESGRR